MKMAACVSVLSAIFIPSLTFAATTPTDSRGLVIDGAVEEAARRCLPASSGAGEKMFACDGNVFDRSFQMYQERKENEGLIASSIKAKFEPNPIAMSREGWIVTFTKQ